MLHTLRQLNKHHLNSLSIEANEYDTNPYPDEVYIQDLYCEVNSQNYVNSKEQQSKPQEGHYEKEKFSRGQGKRRDVVELHNYSDNKALPYITNLPSPTRESKSFLNLDKKSSPRLPCRNSNLFKNLSQISASNFTFLKFRQTWSMVLQGLTT